MWALKSFEVNATRLSGSYTTLGGGEGGVSEGSAMNSAGKGKSGAG
jgi:hypothetical protein